MSWSFEAQGKTKELVKFGVMNDPSVTEWKYCPKEVAEAICQLVDTLPGEVAPGTTVISVRTNGHVTLPDGNGGDVISVTISYKQS